MFAKGWQGRKAWLEIEKIYMLSRALAMLWPCGLAPNATPQPQHVNHFALLLPSFLPFFNTDTKLSNVNRNNQQSSGSITASGISPRLGTRPEVASNIVAAPNAKYAPADETRYLSTTRDTKFLLLFGASENKARRLPDSSLVDVLRKEQRKSELNPK